MLDALLPVLTPLVAVGCGLIAGVFFAFSAFIMAALARLPPAHGVAAMQSINVVVLNPVFLGVFLGTAIGCVLLAVAAALAWDRPGAALLLGGGLAYLLGTVFVTMRCNVPRNEALARVDPAGPAAAALWREYLRGWTRWNHVRTIAAGLALASLMLALRRLAG
jgi:uncharacterized membrane protein